MTSRHIADDPAVERWDDTRYLLSDELPRALRDARAAAHRENLTATRAALDTVNKLLGQVRGLLTEIAESSAG